MILKALSAIDPDDYIAKLKSLIEKKQVIVKDSDPYKLRFLLSRYAAQKGYEQDLIGNVLRGEE